VFSTYLRCSLPHKLYENIAHFLICIVLFFYLALNNFMANQSSTFTAHHVQAVSVGVEVFTRLCTAVSCRAMCTGRRRHGAPQSALRHSRTTRFPSVQHDKLWPTSIFVRRPSCLELTARTSRTNYFNRPFQALSENVSIRADIGSSALETFCNV